MPPSNGGTTAPLDMILLPATVFSGGFQGVMYTFDPTNFNDSVSGGIYSWKVEDVLAGRTPTINRVIISYRDLGIATFNLTIAATDDSGTVVASTLAVTVGTVAASGRIASVVVGITRTGQNLQLSVGRSSSSGPLSITKVRMEGKVETTTY